MTITLNQLVYRIIALYRAMHKNTDNLSPRLVASWIHTVRAMLVKQKLDKNFFGIDSALIQDLGVLKLEEVDSSMLKEIPSGRYMKRTRIDIPHPIMRKGDVPAFTDIRPIDRLEYNYKPVSYSTALVSGFGKFNSRDVYPFYLSERVYLISRDLNYFKHLSYINIKGVFQNPEYAAEIADSDFNWDSPYPVTPSLVDTIEDIIVKTKFNLVVSGVADEKANERDDIVNIPRK